MMTEDKTIRINESRTIRMDRTAREPVDDNLITTKQTKGVGDTESKIPAGSTCYIIKETPYQVIRNLSVNSGEAQVFMVESEGKTYVLKLYYENFKPKEDLLRIIWNMQFELIVKLFDFGQIMVDNALRSYELMEYLEGGTLREYKLNGDVDQFRRIALSASASLAYCHNAQILHKDIKPGNYFFRDKEHTQLVLGDFGISSMYDEKERLHRTTQARTPVYAAPEMYLDVIDGEVEITPGADYYSLGITLLYVWLGRNPFTNNERAMMRMKNEGRLPQLDKLPPMVARVIRGLTCANPDRRWTYDEVERWFKGEEVPVDESSFYLRYKSFVLDPERNLIAQDVRELAPLLNDNRALGIRFLYSKRISQWLEECGNTKLVVELDDIIERRYPTDQNTGLTAAIYALDEEYPYFDVNLHPCHSVQEITLAIMDNKDVYFDRLKDPKDPLYVYLASREDIDSERLSGYFKKYNIDMALSMFLYEVDGSIPFLHQLPSSTCREIVSAFGTGQCTEDQWHSLIDGRLLAFLQRKENRVICESLRLLTDGQSYSETLAYSVLYTIDRQGAYDLKDATTQELIGELLNTQLQAYQQEEELSFEKKLVDFLDLEGRLHFYASIHGWTSFLSMQNRILSLNSRENRERLGVYDIKIAAYKLCAVMGCRPTYLIEDEEGVAHTISDVADLEKLDTRSVRKAMRQGNLKAWLAVQFYENPVELFQEEYSYEHALEAFVETVGKYDQADAYYKRLVIAKEQTHGKLTETQSKWQKARNHESTLKLSLVVSAAALAALLLLFGIPHKEAFMEYIWYSVWLPVGLISMIIAGIRGYFSGNGVTFMLLSGLLGLASAVIPVYLLKAVFSFAPSLLSITMVVMVIVYLGVGLFLGRKASTKQLTDLEGAFTKDVNTELLEPLYYTFKTKSFKYKASKFGLLDDVAVEVESTGGEMMLHYLSWILLMVVMIGMMICYHPSLGNHPSPNIQHWKSQAHDIVEQVKDVR